MLYNRSPTNDLPVSLSDGKREHRKVFDRLKIIAVDNELGEGVTAITI